jgi:DNA-binding transcriptional regulator YiaG
MSVPMKKPRTKATSDYVEIVVHEQGKRHFRVPADKARGLVLLLNEFEVETSVPADEVFKELDEKFGRSGVALQGARLKEGLSQVALAEKLKISQGDLSKMEHGKRTIGKGMAKRLSRILKVDYRVFL